ncbi:hypothetical protein GIB67_037072 [Kingdonia uniflora]|uniref:PPM-type phosphatase domain-containing protein n=1 Tax=Kingdonia uniflora TaxID=39325 RepID=A0A7J7LI16_9MAGN|nr:hypothetical protein GIB67_037072 [Kingdonia uniflora]
MASALTAISYVSFVAAPSSTIIDKKLANTSLSSFSSISSISYTGRRQNAASQRRCSLKVRAAKELHFNKDGSATKKFQIGVNKLAYLVGVTLGAKGRNVVLESKYGSPKILNDGVTVAKEVELEDPVENIGAKLVRQAAANTNDLVGDGITTFVVLAQGLIAEDVKACGLGREDWLQALPRALVVRFVKTDKEFQSRGKTSGTTVTFVIIDRWTVTVASVGDSRCILDSRGGGLSILAVEERERVTASGGEVGRLSIVGGVEVYNSLLRLVLFVVGLEETLRSRGLNDDTTCIVVDIIPPNNSLSSSPPPKKQSKLRSLIFRKRSHDSTSKLTKKLSAVGIVEELFEEGSAMLADRLAHLVVPYFLNFYI